ncbi:MAG: FtsW/RodA/SpoVE family cell cycle protein [Cyanobacteria bacterium P01_F01_bin.42]
MKLLSLVPFFDPSTRKWPSEARFLQWLTGLWLTLGLIVLYSASFKVAIAESGDGLYYLKRQLVGTLIGAVLMGFVVKTPIKQLSRFVTLGFFLCLGLIFAVKIPGVGVTVNGATRWIAVGPVPFQPSEIMKPLLVVQSAQVFSCWSRLTNGQRWRWLIFFGMVLAGILIQPNLSTASLCGMTLWLVAFSAGLSLRYLGLTVVGGVGLASVSISLAEYQRRRIMSFMDPWSDPLHDGYQLIQSLLGVGAGGLTGNGYGFSQQKSYLPFQHTDFIFSVFADEFGLIGCLVLFGLLTLFSVFAVKIAIKSQQQSHRLIAMGCLVLLLGQSLLHIGVTIGAFPTTGLPFPLISYGSNSLISSLLLAGLLVRVGREMHRAEVVPMEGGRRLALVAPQLAERDASPRQTAAWRSWQRRKALAKRKRSPNRS